MYQALYRKYRPSSFKEVVGQDVIVKTLINSIENQKISHAYLFTGPRGTGKTSIAKIFAKTINCENAKNGEACNECNSCKIINNRQSTDVIEIDAASNNGVDEIRNLKSKITLVPTDSKYKVYIIDEVHMLSTGAFNALLKTLEEPPRHVVFILATTEPQKLPTTILSRCQRYDFKRISDDKIIEKLKIIVNEEKIDISDESLKEIARLSDGGLRDSISLLDQVSSYKADNILPEDVHDVNGTLTSTDIAEFITNIFSKKIDKVLFLLDTYNSKGKNIYKLIDEIVYFLRNLLIYQVAKTYFDSNLAELKLYDDISKISNTTDVYDFITNLNNLKISIKDSSNIKTLLEIEIIKIFGSNNKSFPQKKSISQEIKIEKNNDLNPKIVENKATESEKVAIDVPTDEFINIRINNTLSKLDKKIMKELIEKNDNIKGFLLDDMFGKYAALLSDGKLKASSDEYVIYVYDSDLDVALFNSNISKIEELVMKAFNKPLKVVAVTTDDWNVIKDEFNNKKKQFKYQKEIIDNKTNKTNVRANKIDNLFDNIVEYTEEEL